MLIAPSACARRAGLSAAHSAGLVHRDVKPENLFLCDSFDGPRRVKVLDFGYAKIVGAATEVLSPAPHVPTTTEGIMIGTPSY